ncbi:phosphatidylinositol polyphosphate 5-phosphatase type IV [Aplysia californica]|uniref:Phosphatidylinositol polyphosphate 5-phosphatase type IV n=1 Tax=Aplysia californica TaxID=6500 RepID=A0ABM1VNR8_APLCA|nr:phosphatidylinositol polyphosphate 5-phosphatase type IV [Aplysia californica]XP_035824060.1 phosphatidylinositol polyphosphate 5-phosphatase type IV [Aplysia californica]
MQDFESAMETDELTAKPATPRPRQKKKSTLAKLKERKQREQNSNPSVQNLEIQDEFASDPRTADGMVKDNGEMHSASNERVSFPVEKNVVPRNGTKPRPKPRSRAVSSESSMDNVEHSKAGGVFDTDEKDRRRERRLERKGSSTSMSDASTIQRLKNLKMGGEHSDSVESTISQSGFVPKPPITPRTPRTTPRTPRGYVMLSKGEKRNREPGLSGDEPEVEEKKKNSSSPLNQNSTVKSSNSSNVDLDIYSVCLSPGAVNSSNNSVDGNFEASQISSEQGGKSQRLLKRRNSKEALRMKGSGVSPSEKDNADCGKPPISRSANSVNSDRSSSHRTDGDSNAAVGGFHTSPSDLSPYTSPRDKYLKTRSRSKSPSSTVQRQSSRRSSCDRKLSPTTSKPSSETDYESRDNSQTTHASRFGQILLADPEGSNKSTQVIFSSENPHTVRSIATPPSSARLEPINSKSQPPPMTDEFCSHSMRTTYRIDPNARPATGSCRGAADKSDSGTPSTADRLSQKSFASTSVLPVITTKEARSRSYLEGSISEGTTSLLSAEELDRYFPERKVHVLVGTWNMNELKDVVSSLDDFILPEKCDYVQDIYAIGTQENAMNKKEWEVRLQETLGPSHVMFHSVTLGSLHLVVYVRRDLIWFCSTPEDNVISLRAMTMVKTKGAIGICFTLFGTSYLFINCHLTSDRDNDNSRKKNRLGDYCKVIQEMKFPKSMCNSLAAKKTADVTAMFDCVFWFGDLNFRIERKRHAVEGKVHQITAEEFPNFETLLGGDQLHKYMTEGKIFAGFQEGRINFHPTFKFDVNHDTYDSSSKNRVPSYTDRVMFRCKKKNDVTCLHYDAVMAIKISDHRPVYGQYETGVRPGKDDTVYSAGHFDRAVYMEANKRRAASQPVSKRVSSVCSLQ